MTSLSDEIKQQVIALGRLDGRCDASSEWCTAGRRVTYWKTAGIAFRPPGKQGRAPAKPANGVTADSGAAEAAPESPAAKEGQTSDHRFGGESASPPPPAL